LVARRVSVHPTQWMKTRRSLASVGTEANAQREVFTWPRELSW